MVGLLLQLGADANGLDLAGAAPISCAGAAMVRSGIVQMLLDAGGKIDLIAALRLGRYDLAGAMLAQDPQRLGPGGRDTIALHLAIDRKDGAAVRWLIERGVDVNAKRLLYDCNHTALHMCAERGLVDFATELDKFAADALAWAEHCNRPDVAKLIRAHRAAEAPDA